MYSEFRNTSTIKCSRSVENNKAPRGMRNQYATYRQHVEPKSPSPRKSISLDRKKTFSSDPEVIQRRIKLIRGERKLFNLTCEALVLAQRLNFSVLLLLAALPLSPRHRRHSPRTYHRSSRSFGAAPMSVCSRRCFRGAFPVDSRVFADATLKGNCEWR